MFYSLYRCCRRHGFEYLAAERYAPTIEEQIQNIATNKADSFWVRSEEGEMLVSICEKPEEFDFPPNSKIALLHFIFNYYFITTDNTPQNQKFLERVVSLQLSLYTAYGAELGWAGYSPTIPSAMEYHSAKVKALYWFNIFGPRFVETLGRQKLLGAPVWLIKELPDGSVLVRLSEHPHVYEKVGGVYLHECLGLEYMG